MPGRRWDERAIFLPANGADPRRVEGTSVAHELPELYRGVLERVASLELTGHRREGLLIRRDAVAAYSRAWDDATRRRLEQLRSRAERILDGLERQRGAPAVTFASTGVPLPD